MKLQERKLVLDELAASEARLQAIVDGLTPAQWNFREARDRWSIAENVEHVIRVERGITRRIEQILEQPAEPHKRDTVAGKDAVVLGRVKDRTSKFSAAESLYPVGRWPDTTELLLELRQTHDRTRAFAAETEADLRDHFFPHPAMGDLDCYQWLLLLSQHELRHVSQIEEIKANPAYPG